MFSRLSPLFKTVFRKAEQTDARLEIRREEKENNNKKDGGKDEDDTKTDIWEDLTIVSIGALRSFLIDFLKSKGDEVPEEKNNPNIMHENQLHTVPIIPTTPLTSAAAKAQKAYATMSAHAAPVSIEGSRIDSPSLPISLSDLLKADELRTMHVLIAELDILAQKGIQTLTIEKADSFLQALVLAVEKIKNAA